MFGNIPFGTTFVLDTAIVKLGCNIPSWEVHNLKVKLSQLCQYNIDFGYNPDKPNKATITMVCPTRDAYDSCMFLIRNAMISYKIQQLEYERDAIITIEEDRNAGRVKRKAVKA
jgi:hypothetical protein